MYIAKDAVKQNDPVILYESRECKKEPRFEYENGVREENFVCCYCVTKALPYMRSILCVVFNSNLNCIWNEYDVVY